VTVARALGVLGVLVCAGSGAAYFLVEPRTVCVQKAVPAQIRARACRAALLRVDPGSAERTRVVRTLARAYDDAGDHRAAALSLVDGIDGCSEDRCGAAAALLEEELQTTCLAQAGSPLERSWRWGVVAPPTGETGSGLREAPRLDGEQVGPLIAAGTCVFARTAKAVLFGVHRDFVEVQLPRGRAGWLERSAVAPRARFVVIDPPG
jgi:hypothetical protein